MLSLSALAGWESAVLASIAGATGTIEERDRQIERSGMYAEYPAIVRAYGELAGEPMSALEAIKRSVFLAWRSAVELPVVTGIAPLSDDTMQAVVDWAVRHVMKSPVDAELKWMVAWYHGQSRELFALYGARREFLEMVEAVDTEAWRRAGIVPADMRGRGQMGHYWAAKATGAL